MRQTYAHIIESYTGDELLRANRQWCLIYARRQWFYDVQKHVAVEAELWRRMVTGQVNGPRMDAAWHGLAGPSRMTGP
jgi:hypothetical protein